MYIIDRYIHTHIEARAALALRGSLPSVGEPSEQTMSINTMFIIIIAIVIISIISIISIVSIIITLIIIITSVGELSGGYN